MKGLKYFCLVSTLIVSSSAFTESTNLETSKLTTTAMVTTTQISTDEEITKKVRELLSAKKVELQYTVTDGIVSYSGEIPDVNKLKDLVEATKTIPEVKEVKSEGVKTKMLQLPKPSKTQSKT